MQNSILIVAAEASSSLYAQRILETWASQGLKSGRDFTAFGIGSRAMEKIGFACLARSEEMAVVGIQEVIKHFPLIRKTYKELLRQAAKRKTKTALLLDYPDFNLRLAKELKAMGIKVIYYVSPQVWAWRTGRVKLIKRVVDRMLVLFPFEESFYRENGVPVDFVGHPLLDELPAPVTASNRRHARARFGLNPEDLVVGLMPGSRNSEIDHHLKVQLATAALLFRRNPRVRPILMVAPSLERERLRDAIGAELDFPLQIIKEEPFEMIGLADVILVASGTATLMVGMMKVPMVIMYRMNSITAWIAKRLVTKTKFFGMVNLILDRRAVPEFFQGDANPTRLASEVEFFLDHPKERERVALELGELHSRLGAYGATVKVADILRREINTSTTQELTDGQTEGQTEDRS